MTFPPFQELPFLVRSKINEKSYNTLVDLVRRYEIQYIPAELGMEYVSPDERGMRQDVVSAYIDGKIPEMSKEHREHIEQALIKVLSADGVNPSTNEEDIQKAIKVLQQIPVYNDAYRKHKQAQHAAKEKISAEKHARDEKVNAVLRHYQIPENEDFREAYRDIIAIIHDTRSSPTRENLAKQLETFFDTHGSLFIHQPDVLKSFLNLFIDRSVYPPSVAEPIFNRSFDIYRRGIERVQSVQNALQKSQQTAENEVLQLAQKAVKLISEFTENAEYFTENVDFISSENEDALSVPTNPDSASSEVRFSKNSEIGKLAFDIDRTVKHIKEAAIKAHKPWYSIVSSEAYKAIHSFYGIINDWYRNKFFKHLLTIRKQEQEKQREELHEPLKHKKYFTSDLRSKIATDRKESQKTPQPSSAVKIGKFPKR